ncbi:MAG: helix-turn-helix domain-containing protein [Gordonia sp. (in: high G+C Gram-positive bacteria)]|uniref:PucR family transcriptional regulator n=1 Tax=Gordonia sp. (in: high G+C Gram-positive bacteria) TaxID=84139 RepID=UPI0039E6D495
MSRPVDTDHDPRLREIVAEVAGRLRAIEGLMVDAMTEKMLEIDQLDGDPVLVDLLHASVEGNISTMIYMLANDVPLEHTQPTTAAVEYALRLAQRQVPSNSLMRAYQMGEHEFNQQCLDFIADLDLPRDEVIGASKLIGQIVYDYIDWISRYVFRAYENEAQRWIGAEGNVLSATVNQLLDDAVRPEAFEKETGYRLGRTHLAAILWAGESAAGLTELDRVARSIAAELRAEAPPIVTAADRNTVWLWIPFGRHLPSTDAETVAGQVTLPAGARLALGLPGGGVGGFRRSHQQARAAYEVASTGGRTAPGVVGFGDRGIAVVSVMARDLDSTREWVREVLGPLAADNDNAEILRETLSVYYSCGESHVRAAEQLLLHRNTVKYRIGKATDLLPGRHDRMDLALALTVCEYLGSAVLGD